MFFVFRLFVRAGRFFRRPLVFGAPIIANGRRVRFSDGLCGCSAALMASGRAFGGGYCKTRLTIIVRRPSEKRVFRRPLAVFFSRTAYFFCARA
ncbi:hypothetical protein HMPREF9123_2937 [Neisseria bacilliformis ATCC BAA-1200]|uniref:Uncharacterized protein n=1 Tax=Neisseria bacilliformis ATCC BAA-1200 TaxID=888742 RepID=F2BGT0_9NEIS|nr:hypothetical protein HMPREF9123_2937 [Neisseria bacilliformis ATCC BAA-1200]